MKLLHAADFHLDSPFSGLPAELAIQRRQELRGLPARLAELALREKADLLLLPGDLFDGARVYPETIQALISALSGLSIPVIIAPGNHDCCLPGSPYLTARWPEHVHIFTGPAMTSVELPLLNCTVHGCAFTAPHREDEPLSGFSVPEDGRLHLLCLHGEVGMGGRYAPIPPISLSASRADYAALGHIHTYSGLRREGKTWWAYPGCPEGRGFDELGEKGCLLVELSNGQASARFIPLGQRQYRIQPVQLLQLDDILPTHPCGDLVRLCIQGESARPLDLEALAARLSPRFFHLELRDETTLPQDLWARSGEDTLTGLFLRQMRQRLDAAHEDQRERLLLATRFGLAALEGGEDIRP